MSALSSWIITIAAVALIGVVVDIVLPEGQIQKYCRSVFSLIMLLVIISPLPSVMRGEISLDFSAPTFMVEVDESYIESVYKAQAEAIERSAEEALGEQGIKAKVKLSVSSYSFNMRVLSATISTEAKNWQVATQIVADFLKLQPSQIICLL